MSGQPIKMSFRDTGSRVCRQKHKHKHVQLSSCHTATFSLMSEESANDNCRLCQVSFKIQFGNLRKQSHSSSENLFKPSKRKDCFGVVLNEVCRQVGLPLTQDPSKYSDRVCNPCGRKIRNLGQLYQFVKKAATVATSTPVKTSKRTLDTLEKASPPWRKSKSVRINSPPPPPLLLFQPNTHSLGNLLFSPQASSEIESKMALA